MSPQPEMRIGDAEREAAAASLGEHYAAGRLTKQEYDDRTEVVWQARTGSDLSPLFADLPSAQRKPAAAVAARPAGRRGPFMAIPLLPLLAVLVGIVLLTGLPWLILGFAWLLFCGPFGRRWAHPRHAVHR